VALFVGALFDPEDWVCVRLVETWVDGTQKRSRVLFKESFTTRAKFLATSISIFARLVGLGETEHANIFFGVCPRFDGGKQKYDRAFQVRTVRALWADLDGCSPEEAVERCKAAGLPHPSIIVRSGNGVHLYWILSQPYLIDDAPPPPPILTEWVKVDGKNKPRHYILAPDGEKVYEYHAGKDGADSKQENLEFPDQLSPKAGRVQAVARGIAKEIGGDHTHDLSRILRLPGTMNCKDGRNGKPAVPCRVVECDMTRRYRFEDFERFAEFDPETVKAKELEKIRLPKRKLTLARGNRLNDFINRCAVAEVGGRSEVDFALCCHALREGIDKEEVWRRVSEVGKFGERGRKYFDLTWKVAEQKVRMQVYERTCRKVGASGLASQNGAVSHPQDSTAGEEQGGATAASPRHGSPDSAVAEGGFRNYFLEMVEDGEKTKTIKVGLPIGALFVGLQQLTGGWPKRANDLLFVEGPEHKPIWLTSPAELFAWIGGRLPMQFRNKLEWASGDDKVCESHFHAFVRQKAERFAAVEEMPHWPPLPEHFYIHPPLRGGDGRALRGLVECFSPATDVDSDLILSAALTPFAGIEPGQRPAILIQAEDDDKQGGRGAGKTTFAELIARLAGGHISLRPDDNWDRFVTRLLSPAALTKRVALIDNVKTLRFSWADLEAGITDAVISGRQLYVGEGCRHNTLTYFITLNGANLSKDMAQRCVPIRLKRPTFHAAWEERVIRPIEERRWEIIGDIIALLKETRQPLNRYSRWSIWEQAVLSRVPDPSECQKVIEERQAEIDDDQTEADMVRAGIREELIRRGHSPDTEVLWISSKDAA
jgi:hypothetical protein